MASHPEQQQKDAHSSPHWSQVSPTQFERSCSGGENILGHLERKTGGHVSSHAEVLKRKKEEEEEGKQTLFSFSFCLGTDFISTISPSIQFAFTVRTFHWSISRDDRDA